MAKRKRQRRNNRGFLIFITCVALAFSVYAIHWFFNRPSFVYYEAFGIDMPSQYEIHGIDVSRYQKKIGWQLVKEMEIDQIRISFAFMKATEGITGVDKQFNYNWKQAKKAGITRGAYHFFNAGKNAKLQAANFIAAVKLRPGDLPPVLDVEQVNGATDAELKKRVAEWLQIVEARYKVKPIIYTNAHFYETHLAGSFDEYPLWVAHYLQKNRPRVNRNWHFWQHSETGRANGIDARVDFNVFNGDSTDFIKLLIQ